MNEKFNKIKQDWNENVDGHGFLYKLYMFLVSVVSVLLMTTIMVGGTLLIPPLLVTWLLNIALLYFNIPTLLFVPVLCLWVVILVIKSFFITNQSDII